MKTLGHGLWAVYCIKLNTFADVQPRAKVGMAVIQSLDYVPIAARGPPSIRSPVMASPPIRLTTDDYTMEDEEGERHETYTSKITIPITLPDADWLGDGDDDPVRLVRTDMVLPFFFTSQSMKVEVGSWEDCPMQLSDEEPWESEVH